MDTITNLSGFACTCGERGKKKTSLTRAWLAKKWPHLDIHGSHFATQLLYLLDGHWHADVKDIFLDQWGGMSIESEGSKLEGENVHIWMQFDVFEDGLALAARLLYKHYGDERRRIKGDD